jgi:hypothetical protein
MSTKCYRESLNVTHRRLISAFRPPAPDMDSTRTEVRSPKEANAPASHGSSAQTPARSETPSRLLVAPRDILQALIKRRDELPHKKRASELSLDLCAACFHPYPTGCPTTPTSYGTDGHPQDVCPLNHVVYGFGGRFWVSQGCRGYPFTSTVATPIFAFW